MFLPQRAIIQYQEDFLIGGRYIDSSLISCCPKKSRDAANIVARTGLLHNVSHGNFIR
jgi:hypothetical protein